MKKIGILGLVFLLVGAVAFAASDDDFDSADGGGEAGIGFVMNLDNDLADSDVGVISTPGLNINARVFFMNLGNEFTPLNIGVSAFFSYNFINKITWKVPGLKEEEETDGNAFWGAPDPDTGEPEPKIIGGQVLLPGNTVVFTKEDFGSKDSLLGGTLMIALCAQAGITDSFGIVADLGYIANLDWATFNSPVFADGSKQIVELMSFTSGIGFNLGFQIRVSQIIIEPGVNLSFFFSRTDSVDWYWVDDKTGERNAELNKLSTAGESESSIWNDKVTDSVSVFRAAPYIMVGWKF